MRTADRSRGEDDTLPVIMRVALQRFESSQSTIANLATGQRTVDGFQLCHSATMTSKVRSSLEYCHAAFTLWNLQPPHACIIDVQILRMQSKLLLCAQ